MGCLWVLVCYAAALVSSSACFELNEIDRSAFYVTKSLKPSDVEHCYQSILASNVGDEYDFHYVKVDRTKFVAQVTLGQAELVSACAEVLAVYPSFLGKGWVAWNAKEVCYQGGCSFDYDCQDSCKLARYKTGYCSKKKQQQQPGSGNCCCVAYTLWSMDITRSYKTEDYGYCMTKHYRDLAYAISFLPYYWRAMQVADVKKNIETVQGADVYPAALQMFIHQGKVLKDDTTIDEKKVIENRFLVIMLLKVYHITCCIPA